MSARIAAFSAWWCFVEAFDCDSGKQQHQQQQHTNHKITVLASKYTIHTHRLGFGSY